MAPTITCTCGSCAKCKRREYMREWSRANADRVREIARASRQRRLEEVRAYDRARGHRYRDPDKERATNAVFRAVRRGELLREACEVCGVSAGVQAHHDDYAKPLDVRWLCTRHHGEVHRRFP